MAAPKFSARFLHAVLIRAEHARDDLREPLETNADFEHFELACSTFA